ncbi:MAG: hypothetical protein K5856_01510 [Bacteroidaceae bacterium]|nr:hypothetical protein [Bacteroidaceae bacterium]
MKIDFTKIACSLMLLGLASCDDGRLYEEETPISPEGRMVTLTAKLTGLASWPDPSMYVVLAGFNDDSDYALINKSVPVPETDGEEVTIQLSGIKENVTRVELCVINRLRRHILGFYTIDENTLLGSNDIKVDVGALNVGMYHTIQDRVFNASCVNCHGAASSAAAGLYLTAEKSHAAIVGMPSKKIQGMNLVEPGNAAKSALYEALSTDVSITGAWHYNHTGEVVDDDILSMIRQWITHGAKKDE